MRNYIPVKKYWFESYTKFDKPYYTPCMKFPIEKIKIDESFYADKQRIFRADVFYMLVNFDREAWEPILINTDYLLMDGYHRVEVAKQMGLSFIDAVMADTELLEGKIQKKDKIKKRQSQERRKLEAQFKKCEAELITLEKRLGLREQTV